jgi:site-specific recombinase XerD
VSVRKIFSKEEIARFLDAIETNSFYGLRSRVIFELMYSSGLRLMEVVKLDITDVNLDTREALIRCSKFKKDRIVPISEVAEKFLRKYFDKSHAVGDCNKALFLRNEGVRIGKKCITHYFERYIEKAGLEGKGYTVLQQHIY